MFFDLFLKLLFILPTTVGVKHHKELVRILEA
jgi:hypothetical protein